MPLCVGPLLPACTILSVLNFLLAKTKTSDRCLSCKVCGLKIGILSILLRADRYLSEARYTFDGLTKWREALVHMIGIEHLVAFIPALI